MNKLDELINKLCPNGVDFKRIKDVLLSIHSGLNPRQNFVLNSGGDLNYVTVKEITTGKIVFSDKTDKIDKDAWNKIQSRSCLEKDDVLLSGIGTIGKVAVVDIETNDWNCSESVLLLKPNKKIITSWFLKYVLESKPIQDHFNGTAVGSTLKGIRIKDLEQLIIPVPPLEVQCEIVRILDNFDELLNGLNVELRKRQNEYKELANRMFENISKNQKHVLRQMCSVVKGKSPIQKTEPGIYPMVVTTAERKSSKEYQFDCDAVCIPLISSRGHGVASINHVYYQSSKFALGNILCAVIPNDSKKINAKYLYYYFELTKDYTLVPLMKGGANVAMHVGDVEGVKVPVPSLNEQQSIIDALTKFDDYLFELESEIKLRQTQFNYYRDILLTFKEAE